MSGIGSLFQPVPIPQTASSSTQYPLWLEQSLSQLANSGGALAQNTYTPFPGPKVAAPSGQTQQAWGMAGNNVGGWQPDVNAASSMVQGSGAPITASDISTFLNPYQDYITRQLNTNLQQNILPGIQDKFVGAGQSRSPQEAQVTGMAVNGTQQAVGQSLAGAYQGALNSLLQSRQQQQQSGASLGQLGALRSELGIADTGQIAAAGAGQDQNNQANINAALGDFNNQQQWPYQNLSFLSSILHGIPYQATGSTSNATNVSQYGPSPLATFAGTLLGSAGAGLKRGGPVRVANNNRPMGALQNFRRVA